MKPIDIANIQKRRYETYEREKENLIVTRVDGGYTVNNLNKASYYSVTKDSSGTVTCNCKDFTKYSGLIRCKHIISVLKKAERISKPAIKTHENNFNINKEENNMQSNQNNNINNNINNITPEENTDIQALLARPFLSEQIRYRKGFNGTKLSYIETHSVIERLNEAFGLFWNWEVTDFAIEEKQVYCKGRLTVEIDKKTVVKEGFGGKQRSMEIGDDLKSASSDALKKASSLLGVGLYLYKGTQGTGNNTTPTVSTASRNTIPSSRQTPAAPTTPVPTAPVKQVNTPSITSTAPPAPAQPAGFTPKKTSGGNGKSGGNGSGEVDVNKIIKRW